MVDSLPETARGAYVRLAAILELPARQRLRVDVIDNGELIRMK